MNLIKTSFYTSISTGITFLCGFIVAKVVAVKIGPAGIAMVGQFQNTMAILTMLGYGAINMGVVKYLSQSKGDTAEQNKIISNSLSLTLVCSVIVAAFTMLACRWLSIQAFHTTDYWLVYFVFGLCLIFTTLNVLSGAVFNGLKEIKKLTASNIFFSIVGVLFTVFFAYLGGVRGVLLATNATAVCVFVLNVFLFRKISFFKVKLNFRNWDAAILKRLFVFSAMSFVSSLVLPMVQLLVRNKIILSFSTTEAGYWQGVTKISDYYLTFITTVLSIYFLPKLSELEDRRELRTEIFKGYKIILPTVALLASLIYLFRHYIILVLFSEEFLPMEPLFRFQLLGDVIKIASWLLGFLMWAKAMLKTFLITEIFFSITFVLWSYFFIQRFGLIGATYAFATNYTLYFLTLVFVMRRFVFLKH